MNCNYLLPFLIFSVLPLTAGQVDSTQRPKSIVLDLFLSNGTTTETSNEKIYMYDYGQEGAIMQILRSRIRHQRPFIAHSDLLDILTQKNIPPLRGKIKEIYTKFIKPELEISLELLRKWYTVKINKTHEWVVAFPNSCFLEQGETVESLGFNTAELQDFWQHFKGAPPTSLSFWEWLGGPNMTHLSIENFRRLFDFTKKVERYFYVEGHGTRESGKGMIAEMDPLQYRKFLRILQSLSTRKLHIHTCHAEDNIDMHNDCVDEEGVFSLKALSFSITLNSPKKTIVLNKTDEPDKPIRYAEQMREPAVLHQPSKITVKDIQLYEKEYAESQDAKKGWPIFALEHHATNFLYAPYIQTPVFCFPSSQYISMANNSMNHVFQRLYVMQAGLFKKDTMSLFKLFSQSASDTARTFYIKRLQEVLDLRGDEAVANGAYQEVQVAHHNHVAIHVDGKKTECVAKVLFSKENPDFDNAYVHIVKGQQPQKISKEQALTVITGMLKRSEPTADAVLKASDGLQTKEMLEAEIRADLEMMN